MLLPLTLFVVMATTYAQLNPNWANIPCGVPTVQPHTKRIVNGTKATPGSWPWTVLLVDDLDMISGSGVIVHPNVIITSAQHFEGETFSMFDINLHYWKVFAGSYNVPTTHPNEKFYRMRRVIIHPGYNVTSLENDVAVVFMNSGILYDTFTRPACLPDSAHHYTVGEICYLAGWGSTSHTGNEDVLNQVAMPILPNSICARHWVDFFPNTEICAGYENGHKDFCDEDIGSPLMCKDNNGAWYIQGLASSGGDCTKANEPGVFEDITKYSDWIKQTMHDAGDPYPY